MAFGGGGPLHACALARALRIPTVLIPAMPGALSAVGILLADTVRDYSRTVMLSGDAMEGARKVFAELEAQGRAEFAAEGLEGAVERTLDMRYRRQGYELNVAWDEANPHGAIEAFHKEHALRYGFCDAARPVEIVNVRLRMIAAGTPYEPMRREVVEGDGSAACYDERAVWFDGRFVSTRLYKRDGLRPGDAFAGPAMVTEYTAATVLPPGDRLHVDAFGNLILTVGAGA